jgi:hypothetical protein
MDIGEADDAAHVAKRLLYRLSENDADILGRVMLIDMEVTLGLDCEVKETVTGDLVEHVIEETDAGRDHGLSASVEIDGDGNVGLLCAALDGGAAHFAYPRIWRKSRRL